MILIWFNPRLETYYTKFYKHYIENKYFVGYRNSYGHEVIQIFVFSPDNKLYSVYDYCDYYYLSRHNKKEQNKLKSLFTRFFK